MPCRLASPSRGHKLAPACAQFSRSLDRTIVVTLGRLGLARSLSKPIHAFAHMAARAGSDVTDRVQLGALAHFDRQAKATQSREREGRRRRCGVSQQRAPRSGPRGGGVSAGPTLRTAQVKLSSVRRKRKVQPQSARDQLTLKLLIFHGLLADRAVVVALCPHFEVASLPILTTDELRKPWDRNPSCKRDGRSGPASHRSASHSISPSGHS
jgi:hypothetical protein